MADLLVDTDVFVDHLRGHAPLRVRGHRFFYSVVTRAELFAGTKTDETAVAVLLDPFSEIGIDRDIAEEAGRIRRRSGIAMPDALIAATSRLGHLPIVTRNRRHFALVADIRLRSP